MTRAIREPRHAVLTLTGEPARTLAESLLADSPDAIEDAWGEILDRAGASNVGASRLGHDWDPGTGRATFMSGMSGFATSA